MTDKTKGRGNPPITFKEENMKYFVKSHYHGWCEVDKEHFDSFCEHIRKYATGILAENKEEYIKTVTRIETDEEG